MIVEAGGTSCMMYEIHDNASTKAELYDSVVNMLARVNSGSTSLFKQISIVADKELTKITVKY